MYRVKAESEVVQLDDALKELDDRLNAAGMATDVLDPWEAWKVFKSYLAVPVLDDVYDAASYQTWTEPESRGREVCMVFVRQFTTRHGATDDLVGRVVMEMRFRRERAPQIPQLEVWSLDYPTLTDFAVAVESLDVFQAVINLRPTDSKVYGDVACDE